MKYSMRFSDTIHVLAYIAILHDTAPLTSQAIAASVETNPSNIRRIMASLKKAGLIKTTVGKPQPALTRAPEQISLLDIFNSLDEADTNLIQVDPKTNPDCVVGGNIQDALNAQYAHFQKVVQDEMAKTTLADVIQDIATNEVKKRPENQELVANFLNA